MNIVLRELQQSNYGGLNTYLTERHFSMMVGVAAAVHLLAILLYAILPSPDVLDIPVRVLNVKLAGVSLSDVRGQRSASNQVQKAEASEVSKAPAEPESQAVPVQDKSVPVMKKAPAVPMADGERGNGAPHASVAAGLAAEAKPRAIEEPKSRSEQAMDGVSASLKAKTLPQQHRSPRRFVRSEAAAETSAEGSLFGNSTLSDAEMVRRYEQILSLWIEQHKIYPAEARRQKLQGDAVVRIRIDRDGNILRYRLERPTGHALIDNAIGQMVSAANPVPAMPENYPVGREAEFLVPVSFRVLE